MASVFFSYSHRDEELRDRLEVALATLKRQGLIETWHDRMLRAGDEFDPGIRDELDKDERLKAIPGSPPDLAAPPPGCAFGPRCESFADDCARAVPQPVKVAGQHMARCCRLTAAF